jgi:hypothetical protein
MPPAGRREPAGLHDRAESSSAPNLLTGDPSRNAQLAASRERRHRHRFYQASDVEYASAGSFPREPAAARLHLKKRSKARQPGGSVDQELKQLMKELGEAINESLADSDQIAEVVSRIKEGGYDIFLVLEATIGVSKPGDKSADKTSLVTTLSSNPEFKISDQDLKFLKSLRIKIEEDAA